MRDFLMLACMTLLLALGGALLSRAKSIDLGWESSRNTPEYRRVVREAAQAATENGAIHSFDPARQLMRIDIGIWNQQSTSMRLSLMRLASRHFQLQGADGHVDVRAALSNRLLARFDGGNQFEFCED